MSILEDLSKAKKKAKPYAVVGGREVYDYDSLEKKVEIDQAEAKVGGGQVDLGEMKPTKDGWGYTDMGNSFSAIPQDILFINRYKKENDAYLIVTDYRAIKEQSSGQIYASSVQALVIKNKGTKGEEEMYLESIRNVSDTEFINDFTGELSNISMAKVFEAIDKDKVKEVSKDEISF